MRGKTLSVLFFCALSQSCLAVSSDQIADKASLQKKYHYLYSEKVKTISSNEQQFHQATLFRFNSLNVLSLAGDSFEMAFQHGKLLAKEIQDGAALASAALVSNQIDVTYGHRPVFAKLAKNYIDKNFNDQLLSNVLRDYPTQSQNALQEIFALSEASGIPTRTLVDGALNPSVLMMLANGVAVSGKTVRLAPFAGCTSIAAWGPYTSDGKLIIGRNTDYPLTGAFERNATVIYFKPNRGQKHVAVITAGVHSASVLAINEAGVFMAIHSLPSTYTGENGVPPIMWLNNVISEATSVTEAVSKLSSFKFDVGWTFVLASEKENRILSLEVDNSGVGIRESFSGKHVQTNHYLSPALKAHTLFFNAGTKDETFNRFDRASELLEDNKGNFGISEAVRVLADRLDFSTGLDGGYPNTIAASTTSTSVVYKPSSKELYVATGLAPVSGNTFLKLPLPEDFDPLTFSSWKKSTVEDSSFRFRFPSRQKAIESAIAAKQVFEYDNDAKKALRLMSIAAKLAPEVGAYSVMSGLFQIRTGDFTGAKATLTAALKTKLSTAVTSVALYYLGRLSANQSKMSEARTHFQSVLDTNPADSKIYKAANVGLKKTSSSVRYPLRSSDVIPQVQFADSQTY
jgi:hypothetical protein